jgi:hypothetical protein
MTGHEQIIAMRKRGIKPEIVFINDFPCQTDWAEYQEHATVCVHNDLIESLDIRFLVGMAVSVSTTKENRAKALLNACKRASVSIVSVCCVNPDQHSSSQTGFAEIWSAS